MATIGDYVNEIIKDLRLPIGDVALQALFLNAGISNETEMAQENILTMEIALLVVIPKLLLIPDKKQGDSSITWDKQAIVNYYNIRTAELGLPNVLEQENSINDASYIW